MSMDSYQAFIIQRRSDLRRIARQTCGEHTAEDVEVEAWLIAERISTKRGFPVNFSHRADQEQVLAWLHNELVKYADKRLRYAVKLDKDWDKEDADSAVHAMARLLTAPETFDPAISLLRREDEPDPLALTQHSYSQASAYVILLCRFEWDAEELALHLRIVVHTLMARLRWFGAWTRWQASLFDGLQTIALDFEPTKAREFAHRVAEPVRPESQVAWQFAAQPVDGC
ncbi:hypothetical protein [Roseateles puraquae]|uniref:Uncharacterized protein n=1 Tax=Roseateles puraquae TaxID=431059 RepID=A0A254N3C5_9BURK|nr:hypothetical protein [Roseateles puraquae]MDG0857494.1 hypothetical protein [Roseateles puraquae]OWQ96489.1 hypothetical protein CDO81_27135 [Roseateles puraquae]